MKNLSLLLVVLMTTNAVFASFLTHYMECVLWLLIAANVIQREIADEQFRELHALACAANDGWGRALDRIKELGGEK